MEAEEGCLLSLPVRLAPQRKNLEPPYLAKPGPPCELAVYRPPPPHLRHLPHGTIPSMLSAVSTPHFQRNHALPRNLASVLQVVLLERAPMAAAVDAAADEAAEGESESESESREALRSLTACGLPNQPPPSAIFWYSGVAFRVSCRH
jgi:hypothetical protein